MIYRIMKHRLLLLFFAICCLCGTASAVIAGKLPNGGDWLYIGGTNTLFIDTEEIPDYEFAIHYGGGDDPLGPENGAESCNVTEAPWNALARVAQTIQLSNKVRVIGKNAFRGFSNVINVKFDPTTATRSIEIKDCAFADCEKLEIMSFKDVTEIGDYAFSNTAFRYIELPDIKALSNKPFAYCKNLKRNEVIGSSVNNYDLLPSVYISTDDKPVTLSYTLSELNGTGSLQFVVLVKYSQMNKWKGFRDTNKQEQYFYGGDMGYNMDNNRLSYWYLRSKNEMIINFAEKDGYFSKSSAPWDVVDKSDIKIIRYNDAKIVEANAFKGFTSLEKVVLGTSADTHSVETIRMSSFEGCTSLKEINTQNIQVLGDKSFKGCSNLTYLNLNSCTSVGKEALQGCTSLNTVRLVSLKQIGDNAFDGCTDLTDLYFGKAPLTGNDPFKSVDCSKITITIPAQLKGTFSIPFWNQFEFRLIANNLPYSSDGWSISAEGVLNITNAKWFADYALLEQLPWHAYRDQITSIKVDDLTFRQQGLSIGDFMFSDLPNLESASFVGVAKLGKYAFSNCPKLKTIGLSMMSVTEIGDAAFESCASLPAITLYANCKSLGQLVFHGCSSLVKLTSLATTPPSVKSNTFSGMADNNQKSVVLYVDENAIVNYATKSYWNNFTFSGTGSHGDIADVGSFYNGGYILYEDGFMLCGADDHTQNAEATKNALNKYRNKVKQLSVNGNLTTLGDVFTNFTQLTEVDLSPAIVRLTGTFDGCSRLDSVYMPSVTQLRANTFRNSSALTYIDLSRVLSIGSNCFENSGIQSLYATELYNLNEEAFKNCKNLQDAVIGQANIKGDNVFQGCEKLKSFTFNGRVLKAGMFNNCTNLTSVTLYSLVQSIEDNVFANTNLTEIYYYRARPAAIDYSDYENIFSGISTDKITLYVPKPCITTFQNAPTWRLMNIVSAPADYDMQFTLPQTGYFAIATDSWFLNTNGVLSVWADGDMTPWRNNKEISNNSLEQWMPYINEIDVVGETTSTLDDMIPSDQDVSGVRKISLGKNIQTVGRSFNKLYKLEHINCYAEDVPGIYDDAFDWDVVKNNMVKLHVPNKSGIRDAYRKHSLWKKFQIIADLEEVYTVTLDADFGTIEVQEDVNPNFVPKNTVLHLTAVPASGYRFVRWENYTPETGLTVLDDVTVKAVFERILSDIDEVQNNNTASNPKASKILRDGQLLIVMPDGKTYNLQGQRIK